MNLDFIYCNLKLLLEYVAVFVVKVPRTTDNPAGVEVRVYQVSADPKFHSRGEPARVPIAAVRVYSNLTAMIKKHLLLDPEFKEIVNLLEENNTDDWDDTTRAKLRHYVMLEGILYFHPSESPTDLKIVVPKSPDNELRNLMMYEAHDGAPIHASGDRTYRALSDVYFWPHMSTDVRTYAASCPECVKFNTGRSRPRGILQGLTIPDTRWECVQVDWITGLPITLDGFNTILVVSDRMCKYSYFVPAKMVDTAEDTAKRLFSHVFCVHGCPAMLISDRDTKFCAAFFRELMKVMRIKQRMGTSYYHEFNGAVEVLNRTIEAMLRHLVGDSPDQDWTEMLPNIHWAYNTNRHASLQMSPHYALYGVTPRLPLFYVALPEGNVVEGGLQAIRQEEALEFAEHQLMTVRRARYALLQAQRTMETHANRRVTDIEFICGEKVWLWAGNLGNSHFKTTSEKLRERYKGPFTIISRPSPHTYELDLPKPEYARIHPVFHVSMLWRVKTREKLEATTCTPAVAPTFEEFTMDLDEDARRDAATEVEDTLEDSAPLDTVIEVDERQLVLQEIVSKNGSRYRVRWQGLDELEDSDIKWGSHIELRPEMKAYDEKKKAARIASKQDKDTVALRIEQQGPLPTRVSGRQQEKALKEFKESQTQEQLGQED